MNLLKSNNLQLLKEINEEDGLDIWLRECSKQGKTEPRKNYKDVGKGTQRENTLKT